MIGAVDRVDEFPIDHELCQTAKFYDEISGKELPKETTARPRQKEMTEVYAHKISSKVP